MTKVRVNFVIKSIFLTLQFICSNREGDWFLHLKAAKIMFPSFYAVHHFNYA